MGNPSLCKKVDSQTRGLIAKLLREQGASREDAKGIGTLAATEVKQFCTSMTPEGRSVIILTGVAATIVYGVMNWDEVEPKIQDALRRAKVPLTVPIDKVRLPGKLKLGLGLEGFEAEYRLHRGPSTLRFQFENAFKTGNSEISARYNHRTNSGNYGARITHNTGTNVTDFSLSGSGQAMGGTYRAGAGYNTDSKASVFFEFSVRF